MNVNNKIINNYAIELSSFFLGGGMVLIYLFAKATNEYLLILQVVYVVAYLNIAKHVSDLIKSIFIFKCLFILSCFMLGGIPMIVASIIDPLFENVLLIVGIIITIISFYFFCSPKQLIKLGWLVREQP